MAAILLALTLILMEPPGEQAAAPVLVERRIHNPWTFDCSAPSTCRAVNGRQEPELTLRSADHGIVIDLVPPCAMVRDATISVPSVTAAMEAQERVAGVKAAVSEAITAMDRLCARHVPTPDLDPVYLEDAITGVVDPAAASWRRKLNSIVRLQARGRPENVRTFGPWVVICPADRLDQLGYSQCVADADFGAVHLRAYRYDDLIMLDALSRECPGVRGGFGTSIGLFRSAAGKKARAGDTQPPPLVLLALRQRADACPVFQQPLLLDLVQTDLALGRVAVGIDTSHR